MLRLRYQRRTDCGEQVLEAVIKFLLLAGVIVLAGTRLSHYADVIAEKTGLGRTWIGIVLIASVTSIPELATGITATAVLRLPDLAVGDVLGSCMFNLVIIALIDFFSGGAPITRRAHPGQIIAAAFSILLLTIVALALLGRQALPRLGWVGSATILLLPLYALSMKAIFGYEKSRERVEIGAPFRYAAIRLRTAVVRYSGLALVIIAAASLLPGTGAEIAALSGLGETFVGNLFIAFSTSLPEVVVSVAAVRIGAVDLALGNILGSNLFNMVVLAIDDLFFIEAPILQTVSPAHGIAALISIAMTAVIIVALAVRAEKRFFLAWESVVVLLMYVFGIVLLYRLRIPVTGLA